MDETGSIRGRLAILLVAIAAGGPLCLLGWWCWPSEVTGVAFGALTVWLLFQASFSLVIFGIGLCLFVAVARRY